MDSEAFWSLIEKSFQNGETDEAQYDRLVDLLSPLSTNELVSYSLRYFGLIAETFTADLADAIGLINSGVGDDGFFDFRDYLIAKGKRHFERVMKNPESLLDDELGKTYKDWPFREMHFSGAARTVHQIREGSHAELEIEFEWPMELLGIGCKNSSNEECVKARFPRIWKHLIDRGDKGHL